VSGHCGGVTSTETEKRNCTQLKSHGYRGALTTLRSFSYTDQEEDDGDKPGLAHTMSGSCSWQAALRREQLVSKHHANYATGRKMKESTALGREEIAVCL
jgi:hypothetical protein